MVTILSLGLGACSVGEVQGINPGTDGPVGTDSGGNSVDKMTFNQQVAPLVTRCTGCHGALQDPNLQNYDLLKPMYKTKPGAQNILITKDVIDGTPGLHEGITYLNQTEKDAIAAWIDGQTGM